MNWRDYFIYDESSPSCLRWAKEMRCGINHNRVLMAVGDIAGTITSHGYYSVCVNGIDTRVHRVIYGMFFGVIGNSQVDHKDGNRLNNKKENLRLVDATLNHRNMVKMKNNTSGVTGVTFVKKQKIWRAIWIEHDTKKKKIKGFSVRMFGDEEAFKLACDYRFAMIKHMNDNGAGYTERHGK